MKLFNKFGVWLILFSLMSANVYIFVIGLQLSDEIHTFEQEITRLKRENKQLETEILQIDSITFADSVYPELGFTREASPVYVESDDKSRFAQNAQVSSE